MLVPFSHFFLGPLLSIHTRTGGFIAPAISDHKGTTGTITSGPMAAASTSDSFGVIFTADWRLEMLKMVVSLTRTHTNDTALNPSCEKTLSRIVIAVWRWV